MDYWVESVEVALAEAGVTASAEQIREIAASIEVDHENYGMAHGYDAIPNPLDAENKRLADELHRERTKVICEECRGTGWITSYGPYHSSTSQCFKCGGEGRRCV